MFKNQIKLISLTFFLSISFFILINFLLAESNQNFLEVKNDIYSNLNNTNITDISNEVLIATSTNIDNNQIETSTSSNLENFNEENNTQENDNQENTEKNNEEGQNNEKESNEEKQTESSQSETTSNTTTTDSDTSTSTSTNNSTNSNDSGSINRDNHQTGGSTFYNSENNSQENNNQENIEENNNEEENEEEETEPSQPQLKPEESPQPPLKQRKLEKEVKIDFSAPYICKAKNFSIDLTGKNQVFVELELLGTKPQNSTLEIGNLPLGIDITFLNTTDYNFSPLPNETTAVLQITNQPGSQKGNFNIIILYTDNSTQKSSTCQVNIVNL